MLLVGVTGVAFVTFDARSHSASDTLRLVIITLVPAWGWRSWSSKRWWRQ